MIDADKAYATYFSFTFFPLLGGELPEVGTLEVLVIILAIVLFGPKRIPEIARTLGSVTRQLRQASDEFFREISQQAESLDSNGRPDPATRRESADEGETISVRTPTDDQVAKAAQALGIDPSGKTKEQLKNEIISRLFNTADPYGLDVDQAP